MSLFGVGQHLNLQNSAYIKINKTKYTHLSYVDMQPVLNSIKTKTNQKITRMLINRQHTYINARID